MTMRRGYTLIEIIITVAITGILSVGMFKAFEAITLRSEKAKILATLSIDSQSALDQISILLYNRSPMSVKGFNKNDPLINRPLLSDAVDKTIIEWYGLASESYTAGDYSGFVDMNRSLKPTLYTPNTNLSAVLTTEQAKWGPAFTLADMGLIFASFSDGGESYTYTMTNSLPDTITLTNPQAVMNISEKYYLIDSAYAIARGADIDQSAPCITALGLSTSALDNTLLLFYDYRPWNTQSFCADSVNQTGQVTILSTNVNAFRARVIDGSIRLTVDTNRTVRGGNPVRLSKQKVVF